MCTLMTIVFILFWGGGADQVSCRSYVGSAYRMRSLAVSHSFMYFRTVGLSDPIRCVLKHGTGHAVKCLNVLAGFVQPHFFFAFRDTYRETLVSLRPETRDVATRVSGRK